MLENYPKKLTPPSLIGINKLANSKMKIDHTQLSLMTDYWVTYVDTRLTGPRAPRTFSPPIKIQDDDKKKIVEDRLRKVISERRKIPLEFVELVLYQTLLKE